MANLSFLWQQPYWQAEARAWIHSALRKNNLQLTGEIEQPHVRQWSTVMTVPTGDGMFFFKESNALFAYETVLTDYLARFRSEIFPELLAVDTKRHWMLMRDAGIPLRQFIRSEKSIARWKDVLPIYVSLQKDMAEHTAHLLTLGVMDRRLARLPEIFEGLISDESGMLLDQEDSLTSEEYARLKNYGPAFKQMCEELASFGIPETVHHDDFHDGNIFVRDGRIIFTDWGESAVAHPFFTLVVMMRGIDNSMGVDFSPESKQVRDMYLEHWTSYATMEELRSIAKLAQRLGYVNRALTWKMSLDNMPEEIKPEYAMAVPSYLKDFVNDVD
ncbi:MAG TPA: phosphotransferase [Anaerolineales bacterium]|nr:phosphotransferase [Anaerolineales bacterium]